MDNPYEWLQSFIDQMPAVLQPVIVALAGAIPYVEGEGAAALGIIAGINPVVAALAGATGNILGVLGVVLLGSRVRQRMIARRTARSSGEQADGPARTASLGRSGEPGTPEVTESATTPVSVLETPRDDEGAKPTTRTKGRARLSRWLVRFGVPGTSLLAPLALPTMLTAAFLVGSGVPKEWVILWQVVAIILWTSAVAIAATGALALLGW